MATIPIDRMEVARTVSGNTPLTLAFPEAASQTFKKGDVVTFDSVGHVIVGTGNEDRIVGVAASDGTNSTTAASVETTVWIANEDTVFRANSNSTTHLTDVGRAFQITTSSTKWVIDKATGTPATANRRVIVVRLDPRDVVGDTNGRYEFIFWRAATAFAFTS